MKKWLMVVLVMLLSCSAYAVIEVHEFETVEQERQFHELNQILRCPKCQNNTIGDSNAELALDLRQKVYEMTIEGKSKQEIIDFMVERYGNFVTYNPSFTFATAILWLGPLFVVLIGVALMLSRIKRHKTHTEPWSLDDQQRLDALLNKKQGEGE